MAGDGRKRARAEAAEEPAGPPAKRSGGSQALAEVERELASINELLQTEETSQKQTWQIGKRVKKILDGHPELPTAKQLDAFFLWGTALARLASLNEDPTLAEAAADKFQQMHELSGGDEAAFGPVGFTLWGSSLMIVATETRDRAVLDKALAKFEQAVDVDGGTTFESRFQYAKSLKEGGDLLRFLEDGGGHEVANEYYQKALAVCDELEKIYERESSKEVESDTKKDSSNDNDESGNDEDVDEDDDIVTVADYAEVKLLEAILQGTLESSDWATRFERTLALFYKALELSPNNPEALMELTNYLARRCVMASKMPAKERPAISWQPLFDDLESKFCSALLDVEFPIEECHEICVRCDTVADFEPDMDGIDVSIPHMLNSLGKGLAAFLRAFPEGEAGASEASEKKKVKPRGIAQKKKLQKQKQQENPRFVHAVEVLRSAHHLHDKLGAYHLSCLFASPAFLDEQKSREWLETASSYGALEDDFDPEDFGDVVRARPWFQKFLQPEEMLDESELAQQ